MLTSLRRQPQRVFATLLLAGILGLAAVLRLTSLSQRGLIYWDEGKFALEGMRFLGIFRHVPGISAATLTGKAVGTAKPTHALLISLSYAILGVRDYAPLAMNAVASVLAVGVLFFLAKWLFDERVALVAAAFLAISGYDIVYARSALSESDANLIFLLGALLWWRRRGTAGQTSGSAPAPFWAGLVLGIGFTVNYRLGVYIGTLVAIDLAMAWRREGGRRAVISGGAWAAGLLAAPLAWELVGLLAQSRGIVLFRSEITYRPTSYFAEVLYQLHQGRQSAVQFNPLAYAQWYVARQGWPMSILLLVGFAFALRDRLVRWLVPAALVAIPYAVYSFAPLVVPRNLDTALPFAALLVAGGVVRLARIVAARRSLTFALAGLTVFTAVLEADHAWSLTGVRSGFALATSYLRQHHSEGAIVVNEIMLFYLRDPGRGCDAPVPAGSGASLVTALAADLHAGSRYAVIDSYAVPVSWYLLRHAHAVRHFPTMGVLPLGENLIASENGFPPGQGRESVDIYALPALHLKVRGVAAPVRCNLEHLA